MVKVEFLGPIAKSGIEVKATNLKELKEILRQDSTLKEWLNNCAIALNDEIITSLETTLKAGDKISLLPPVCGG